VRLPALFAVLLLGCSAPADAPRVVSVFAASSLTEGFGDLERAFEASHPGVDVQLTFGGSQVLRLQIEQGAPADVFASADEQHVASLVQAGLAPSVEPLADNQLVVVAPKAAPALAFADLATADRIVLGTAAVPAGRYARQVLDAARQQLGDAWADAVLARIASEEGNVRLVRAKVELGEADAAFVYRTDATERLQVVPIPDAFAVRARYGVAVLSRRSPNPDAEAFAAFLRSPEATTLLTRRGFLAPSPR
jgi:molybdate transport system substrate-binding protein